MATEVATLGGGCFWCLEAVFQDMKGIHSITSGYSGGFIEDPNYEMVSMGITGHAEVVNINFDPAEVSYYDILRIFFMIHDPTTPNRQGNDIGPQYRSVVFYHTPEQERIAREVMMEVEKVYPSPVVTQLEAFTKFYPAEDYLQNFYKENPEQSYCMYVIAPKVSKSRQLFMDRFKS